MSDTTLEATATTVEAPAKVKRERIKPVAQSVTTSSILAMLDAGKNRTAIKKELGLSGKQAKALFGHEKIKGYKMAYTKESFNAPIEIIDDAPARETVTAPASDTVVSGDVVTEQAEVATATPAASTVPAGTSEGW